MSDANIFFLSDKDLDEQAQVVYKGSSFPNQFRTNTVILSEACPRQFTINLDFPSGLYSTYTQTVNDETKTKYAKIPLWMCIQWRIYNSTKTSSDPKGFDYDDWNTIDFGPLVNKTFSTSEQNNDKAKHKGNEFDNLSLDDLYQGFRGKTLQNFEYYSGDDGVSEFRVSATVTLTKEQCKQVIADTNPARIIEIRVLRVSPNYLNQSENNSDSVGPYSYSDHVKVLTTVVKTFDMEALRKDDELKPVRVLSEKDLKKLCLVAIKAKADKAGYLQNNMESITCTAESFSPIWDSESKKILPEGTTEKITKVRKYYGYFEGNTDIKANRTDAAYERELTGPNAKEQYEEARHEGYDWYMEKAGSNFPALIKNEVYDDPVLHNDTLCWYLPDRAKKFNNNLASSGSLLALFGEQSGPEATGLEDLNIVAFSDWAEKSAAVNDGTTAPMAMDYNGHHYNKGDLIPVRYEANAYIYQGTKIEDLLQKLAFCGRAAWVIDEAGQVKFIMDATVDYTKGAINAQNCISSSNSFNYEEPPAGLFITFHDENDGFENNSFYVWTDGNSASRYHGSVEQLSMDYVTNNVQVTSLARYTLASRVQNKEILTRKIGPNGIIYSLGDVVLVQSDELLIGDVSGRIQEVIENNGTIYGFIMDSDYEYTAELDSNNVNSNQGVTIIQPSYMGKSNAVTLPLSSPRTQSVPLDYEQVYPVGTENPQEEGWYVKNGDEYVLTTDTTVVSGHVYYKAIMVNYTLQKGITNIVLFGKVIGDQYGIPRDTSGDYSAKTDIKYNFKTGDIAMMGLIEKISAPYRISKIKPEAGGKFTETLIPYDESFYNYGKALPTFQSYITPPPTMSYSVPLSETPTTLKEQNDTLLPIYKTIENLSLISYSCVLTMSAIGSAVTGTIYKDGVASTDNFYYVDYYGTQGTQPTTAGAEGVVLSGSFTIAAVSSADKHKVMIYSDNTKAQLICTAFVSFGDGSDSSSYWLIEDVASIKKDKNGTFTPQTLNLTAKYQTGTAAPSAYSGRFKIEYATVQNPTSNQWTVIYTSSNNESEKELNISSYTTAKIFRCSLYMADGTSVLLDQDVVPVVDDGLDGENAIAMTSATTPSGTYEGQIGVWQGQIYLWNGTNWVCQETNVPTDAVLHYSFDEVPDYPDGSAIYKKLSFDSTTGWSTFNATLAIDHNGLKVQSNGTQYYFNALINGLSASDLSGKIIKMKLRSNRSFTFRLQDNGGSYSQHSLNIINLGNNEYLVQDVIPTVSYNQLFTFNFGTVSASDYVTIETIYIGDGSYNTPVIDNANGQNNSVSAQGFVAQQGVSGKGVSFYVNNQKSIRVKWNSSNWDRPYTVSAWIKSDGQNVYIVGWDENYNVQNHFIRYNNTNKNIWFDVNENTRFIGYICNIDLDDGQWHNVVCVNKFESGKSEIWVDGIKQSLTTQTRVPNMNDDYFLIGNTLSSPSSYANINGAQIDDYQIFDRALSETEVKALYLNKANTPKYYTLTDYQIEGIDDDGIVSPAEKEMLYQKWIDIYKVLNGTTITKNSTGQSGEYQKMFLRATTAGVSLDVAQGKDYVDATETLRAGLWTTANLANMSVQTKISAGAIDNLFNSYRTAYEALSTAIDVQNKATASALSISQSNSYHQIPTNASGTALSYVGTDDIIYLLEGESKLTCVSTGTTLTTGKWKITAITMTNCTSATTKDNYTISDKGASIGILTGISADSAKRTFTIQFIGNNASTAETIQIVQSFAKSKAGADGSSYRLIAEAYCVKTSTTVKFDAQKITGESVAQWIDGYLFYSTGSSWTSLGQFKNGTAYKQLSLNVTADTSFRLCKSNSATDYVDELSVKIFKDGDKGDDSLSCDASISSVDIATGTDLKPTSVSSVSIVISAFKGTTALTATTGTPTASQFKVTTPSNITGITFAQSTAGTITASWTTGTAIAANASVTINIAVAGSTNNFTKVVKFAASVKGETGAKGSSNQTYQCVFASSNIYLYGLNTSDAFANTAQPYFYFGSTKYTPTRNSSNYCIGYNNVMCNAYIGYVTGTVNAYDPTKTYKKGDIVSYTSGSTNYGKFIYINATATSGNAPTSTTYWQTANVLAVYVPFGDSSGAYDGVVRSVLTNTKIYRGNNNTTNVTNSEVIVLGRIRQTAASTAVVWNLDPTQISDIFVAQRSEIVFKGIVWRTHDSMQYDYRYQVNKDSTVFTKSETSTGYTAEPGDLVYVRGSSATEGATTGAADTEKKLKIYNGYDWEEVSTTKNKGYLQACQNSALIALASVAKVYKANNVTIPDCCGQVIDLLIANAAVIEKLVAQDAFIANLLTKNITVQDKGVLKSNNFNGTINSNGEITETGTVGWAIDHNGVSSFSNMETPIVTTAGNTCFFRCAHSVRNPRSGYKLNFNYNANITGVYRLEIFIASFTGTSISGSVQIQTSQGIETRTISGAKTTITLDITQTEFTRNYSCDITLTFSSAVSNDIVTMVVSLGEGNIPKTSWIYPRLVESCTALIGLADSGTADSGFVTWSIKFYANKTCKCSGKLYLNSSFSGGNGDTKVISNPIISTSGVTWNSGDYSSATIYSIQTTPVCNGQGMISGVSASSNSLSWARIFTVYYANKNASSSNTIYGVFLIADGEWYQGDLGGLK